MVGQSTCGFFLIVLATLAAVRAKDDIYDFSENGMIEGMSGTCAQADGTWKNDDASNYYVEGAGLAPPDGNVIVTNTISATCLKLPERLLIDEDFKIKLLLFVPVANNNIKLQLNIVDDITPIEPIWIRQPTVAGWNEVEITINPARAGLPHAGPYEVQLYIYLFEKIA